MSVGLRVLKGRKIVQNSQCGFVKLIMSNPTHSSLDTITKQTRRKHLCDSSKTSHTGQHDLLITKLQKYSPEEGSLEDRVPLIEETTFAHLLLAVSCQIQRIYEVLKVSELFNVLIYD